MFCCSSKSWSLFSFFPSLAWMISFNLSLGLSECIAGVSTWIRLCFSTLIVVCSRVSYQLPHWDLLTHFPSGWHKWKGFFLAAFLQGSWPKGIAPYYGRGTVWNLSRETQHSQTWGLLAQSFSLFQNEKGQYLPLRMSLQN